MANQESSTTTTTTTTPQVIPKDDYDDILTESFTNNYSSTCCSFFPCFGARPSPARSRQSSPSVWERLHRTATAENKWWAGPVSGLKKAREWSKIMAGPKWKTFIRRFNINNNNNINIKRTSVKTTSFGPGKFQYDPLSYSLNFDEGRGHNGNLVEESGYFPDFSSRFASIPSSFCTTSVDFGKTATPIVNLL